MPKGPLTRKETLKMVDSNKVSFQELEMHYLNLGKDIKLIDNFFTFSSNSTDLEEIAKRRDKVCFRKQEESVCQH